MVDKRLIDANALHKVFDAMHAIPGSSHLDHLVLLGIKKFIDDTPTIDAVEVVRCRVWIHRVRTNSTLGLCWCGKFGNVMRDADFCSWGERKMDGGAE